MGEHAAEKRDRAQDVMGRRAFLIGGAGAGLVLPLLPAGPALAQPLGGIPASGKIAFHVLRKGAHIGESTVTFSQDSDGLTVRTEVHIQVKVGPVPVYRYTHVCNEHWNGNRFTGLESTTNSNMSHEKVTVRRLADGLHIDSASIPSWIAPIDSLPQTHWNRFAYMGPMFNPQDGKPLKEILVSRTPDTVKLVDGSSISATRWSMTGDGVMDDFYDANGVWVGLHAKVQDGSYVEYVKI
jgi:hypothetical protein